MKMIKIPIKPKERLMKLNISYKYNLDSDKETRSISDNRSGRQKKDGLCTKLSIRDNFALPKNRTE